MPGVRLTDLEQQRKDERREASRWRARNAHRLPSEELPRQRVVRTEDGERWERETVLYGGAILEVGEEMGIVYAERHRFVPLQGHDKPIDLDAAYTAARVDRAMRSLPVRQQNLLNKRHLQGLTLKQLARLGESKQAVQQRVRRANLALLRAIVDQADDPLELTVEDF